MGHLTRIILFSCIIHSYLSMCPEDSDGTADCIGSPGKKKHCQYDAETDNTTTACAREVNCSAGEYAAIEREDQVTCVPCSPEMYQPHAKLSTSFTQPNCDVRKTPCLEGELKCEASSTSQNYRCKCDANRGWKPNPPGEKCDCFDKETSVCVCQETTCKPGQKLASNFTCVPVPAAAMTPEVSSVSGSTVAAIIVGVLLVITISIIIWLVILLKRREKWKGVSSKTEVEANPPSDEEQNRKTEDNLGERLCNRIRKVFIESVEPRALLLRLDLGAFNDERLRGYIDRNVREDGAAELLQTVKRQCPNDWFEKLIEGLRHDDVSLSHTADAMEDMRKTLLSETAELQNSVEQASASEEIPLVPTAPPGHEDTDI